MFELFKDWTVSQFIMGVASSITATFIVAIITGAILKLKFINIHSVIKWLTEKSFKDSRDKQKYRVVKIGKQTWMAQNLNYTSDNNIGKCYDNNSEFGDEYGRLYTWEEAIKACPSGWHLPTKEEWETLIKFAGGRNVAGHKLKAKEGWHNKGNGSNGNDKYGFSALPGGLGGFINLKETFDQVGHKGVWWSATEKDSNTAYSRGIDHDGDWAFQGTDYKTSWLSVRALKD